MEQKVFETDDIKIEITVEEKETLDRNKAKEIIFTKEYMRLIPKEFEDKKEFILNIIVKEIKKSLDSRMSFYELNEILSRVIRTSETNFYTKFILSYKKIRDS